MNDTGSRHYEIILAGSGGQGLVSSGNMLGEAATFEGKNVIQTASYGGSQRGGSSVAEVIISDDEILFQRVQNPNMIMALTDDTMNQYLSLAELGVPIFYDTTLVQEREGSNLYGYPFTAMANEMGHSGMANVIGLGAMIAKSGVIRIESFEEVLRRRFSGKMAEMNLKALRRGVQLVS